MLYRIPQKYKYVTDVFSENTPPKFFASGGYFAKISYLQDIDIFNIRYVRNTPGVEHTVSDMDIEGDLVFNFCAFNTDLFMEESKLNYDLALLILAYLKGKPSCVKAEKLYNYELQQILSKFSE